MKLTKTCRKLDGYTQKAVALVEEQAKVNIAGFVSLTYTASFNNFPASLRVVCLFTDDIALGVAKAAGAEQLLQKLLHKQMFKVGFILKDARHNVILQSVTPAIIAN
ncbi:hypothetical protein [Rheinheimera sp. MMS21-TC3]|uniref:hypothetical protein n=1 Tax=Rheinheimera sp. MMS21-TC3 TaxID=3072790 RepID=UPI0028C463C2|nr:hypothetical protein [Rheinheimera sp. MMS21-TC3]WNO60083.1 hypothetical protein RDV63_03745 [Rheinheimera sp. MMS21-TC3]